jgi:hypothetical protein
MSPAHLRYLLLEQGIGSVFLNFPLNWAIAWAMFRGAGTVPMWGQQGIAGDTIGTSFILPFLTGLIVTQVARAQVRRGRVPALGWTRRSHPILRWLPAATLKRAITIGAACALTIGPLAVWVLHGLGIGELPLRSFLLFKASYAAALGVLVTPLLALWAIANQPEAAPKR